MATKSAIAIGQHYATERIILALNRLLLAAGMDNRVEIPRQSRYPELLHNQQLEAIATNLELLSPPVLTWNTGSGEIVSGDSMESVLVQPPVEGMPVDAEPPEVRSSKPVLKNPFSRTKSTAKRGK